MDLSLPTLTPPWSACAPNALITSPEPCPASISSLHFSQRLFWSLRLVWVWSPIIYLPAMLQTNHEFNHWRNPNMGCVSLLFFQGTCFSVDGSPGPRALITHSSPLDSWNSRENLLKQILSASMQTCHLSYSASTLRKAQPLLWWHLPASQESYWGKLGKTWGVPRGVLWVITCASGNKQSRLSIPTLSSLSCLGTKRVFPCWKGRSSHLQVPSAPKTSHQGSFLSKYRAHRFKL